jgi:hypothetical protein
VAEVQRVQHIAKSDQVALETLRSYPLSSGNPRGWDDSLPSTGQCCTPSSSMRCKDYAREKIPFVCSIQVWPHYFTDHRTRLRRDKLPLLVVPWGEMCPFPRADSRQRNCDCDRSKCPWLCHLGKERMNSTNSRIMMCKRVLSGSHLADTGHDCQTQETAEQHHSKEAANANPRPEGMINTESTPVRWMGLRCRFLANVTKDEMCIMPLMNTSLQSEHERCPDRVSR